MSAVRRPTEEAAIERLFERAATAPAGLIVRGDAGIGKSTLWFAAVQAARGRGFHVLAARAGAAEVSMAFAALADLFADVPRAVWTDLPPVQASTLDAVLAHSTSGRDIDERAVGAAALTIVERLTVAGPVLLAIDDVQWLDSPTRAVLSYLVGRVAGPVGALAVLRSDADPAHQPDWLRFAGPSAVDVVDVGPLAPSDIELVLTEQLGVEVSAGALRRIVSISGGNPLYAVELARIGVDRPRGKVTLPHSLRSAISERIGQLTVDVRSVLLLASAAAAPTVDLLSAASGLPADRVTELLEDARARDIIDMVGSSVRFTHPMLSWGVYTSASAAERRRAHRALAGGVGDVELQARHLALAATEADAETLTTLDAAVELSLGRGALAAAGELVEAAIALGGGSAERILQHAEILLRLGDMPRARQQLEPLARTLTPGTLRARALSLLGAVRVFDGHLEEAASLLEQALDDADPSQRIVTMLRLSPVAGTAGDREKSLMYARLAVAGTDHVTDTAGPAARSLRSQALASWVNVTMLYGYGVDEAALHTALRLEDPEFTGHLTYFASAVEALMCSWLGTFEEAVRRFGRLYIRCRERGADTAAIWVAEHAMMAMVWSGRYRDAERIALEARRAAERIGGPHLDAVTAGMRAVAAAHLGDVTATRAHAAAAMDAAQACGGEHFGIAPRWALGFLDVSLGRYRAAGEALEPLIQDFDPRFGTEIVVSGFFPDAIEMLVTEGRTDDAEVLIAALETQDERFDRPWMRATSARGRAMLAAATGDLDHADASARKALDAHDLVTMPFERARTQLLLGQIARRRRRPGAAVGHLASAIATFDELGTVLWAQRARSEQERVAGAASTAVDVLSPAEIQVASCAADGLTNRQIAATLFVSEKTVEMHLSRIYRKLGIRSRAVLSAALESVKPNG